MVFEAVTPYINIGGCSTLKWEDDIKIGLRELGFGAWTGLIWLRIGTGGWHL
jgi:hypothetical protein